MGHGSQQFYFLSTDEVREAIPSNTHSVVIAVSSIMSKPHISQGSVYEV